MTATHGDVEDLKDELMLKRSVLLSKAEAIINNRKITIQKKAANPKEV